LRVEQQIAPVAQFEFGRRNQESALGVHGSFRSSAGLLKSTPGSITLNWLHET